MIKKGADVNATNVESDTPLHLAAAYNRAAIVRLLPDADADAEIRGARERTPLD